MQLQVELARPHRSVRVFRLCGPEERVGISYDDAGRSFEVPQPPSPFQHLAGWATPTVAVSEGQQGSGPATLVGKVSNGVRQLLPGQRRVVGVSGREMREDPRAIEAFPPKGVVRKSVRLVPGDLLGQEPPHPGQVCQLREGSRIPERVGQPDARAVVAEFVQEEPLTRDELPDQGLAAGEVAVGFDPHAAGRYPLPLADRALYALI